MDQIRGLASYRIMENEPILRHFQHDETLDRRSHRMVYKMFAELASQLLVMCPERSPERSVALRKLMEGLDAALRAVRETISE